MRHEKKEEIGAALLRASPLLTTLGLLALVAAFQSSPHRPAILLCAQALSLCSIIAFMGGWRLLLDPADPKDERALAWWSTTVALLVLLGIAYWGWVGEFW